MRLIATFSPGSAWGGNTIQYEDEQFVFEGHGVITAADVLAYDDEGLLDWATDDLRDWVRQIAVDEVAPPVPPDEDEAEPRWTLLMSDIDPARRRKIIRWFVIGMFLLIEIVPAIGLLVYKVGYGAQESTMPYGGPDANDGRPDIYALRDAVMVWSAGHGGHLPEKADRLTLWPDYIYDWPVNPYTGRPSEVRQSPGNYTYWVNADRLWFTLVGYDENGDIEITLTDPTRSP